MLQLSTIKLLAKVRGHATTRTYFECRFMTHFHFDMGYSESTFSKYAFGRGEGVTKKSTLCTLVKMMTIMDDPLVKWSEKWQMLFNFGKCKCLHTGPGNTGMKEKDLGVTMNASMKVSEQCRIAASKGNQILGMIRRNITYIQKRV